MTAHGQMTKRGQGFKSLGSSRRLIRLNTDELQWRSACLNKDMKSQSDESLPRLRGSLTRDKSRASDSAGQSGDLQGLSDEEDVDSESVVGLLEEGQAFEAEAIGGIENVVDADLAEVQTRQVLEDDVPLEYLNQN
jgi:hypothetical protein